MKKQIMLSVALLLSTATTRAYSDYSYREKTNNQMRPYVKAAGGLVIFERFRQKCSTCTYQGKPETSFSGSIAAGYDFHKNISGEVLGRFSKLKWSHTSSANDSTSQKTKFYSLFANIYLKHSLTKLLTPYLTFGPGYTFNKSKTLTVTSVGILNPLSNPGKDISSFAWNIGFGSMLKINNNFSADIAYRYMHLGKVGFKASGSGIPAQNKKINAHDISIGLIYKF
ncbi:MAG: porin family protein [Rickettsiales bacterium]|nr:porin family protein [Rickettsiales bacterium]